MPETSAPFSAPHARPVSSPAPTSTGTPAPACIASPIAVDTSAMIEATDRSISPAMISIAMAKAIIAFSVKLKVASLRFQAFRKYGEAKELIANTASATTSRIVSQLRNARVVRDCRRSGMVRAVAGWVISPPSLSG